MVKYYNIYHLVVNDGIIDTWGDNVVAKNSSKLVKSKSKCQRFDQLFAALKKHAVFGSLYIVVVLAFVGGAILIVPTWSNRLGAIIIGILFIISFRVRSWPWSYILTIVSLGLHHWILLAIRTNDLVNSAIITPFIIGAGLIYALVLRDIFTPIVVVLTLCYHFTYTPGTVEGRTFVAVLVTVLSWASARYYRILTIECDRFYKASITDSLTGLYTFTHSVERGQQWIDAGKRFMVVFFDLNNFRKINDTYGHLSGNRILIQFA
jgi:predicted signal transduction protein with EAL and GGDEF domain